MKNYQAAQAKDLLTHYFRISSEGPWSYGGDNTAEIEEIVDLIIRAATKSMQEEIERLEARINELEVTTARMRDSDY